MIDDGDGSRNVDRPKQEAEGTTSARESMIARQKLIEAMIDNNMRQLKFDSAHGGAEIERAWAVREISLRGDDPALVERLAEIDARLARLEEEHRGLVAEREWLNKSLLEFDDRAAAARRFRI
jgi:hypothetical protein